MLTEHRQIIEGVWQDNVPAMTDMLNAWEMDVEQVLAAAHNTFNDMLESCAYTDAPASAFGRSFFFCLVYLALFQQTRHQVDAHQLGSSMLAHMRSNTPAFDAKARGPVSMDIDNPGTHPGEFGVEVVDVKGSELSWGMNITSCGICYQFSRFDSMDLVPYMCAADDVISDKGGQGLHRTGTIALGASHCDFRYDPYGEPQRVADVYPEQIKFVH